MPLRECMAKTSHREYLAWQEWLSEDLNRPGKTEWYLAALTATVASMFAEEGVSPSDCLLKFGTGPALPGQEEPELTPEEHHQRLVARLKAMGCDNPEEVIRAGKPVQLGAKKEVPTSQRRGIQLK